jgi:hypothetical protein
MRTLRSKLTYANVMVTVLAFAILGGGTAYASMSILPKNSVGSKQLKPGSVTPAKLSSGAQLALKGLPGAQGATGAQGAPGADGARGPIGLTGAAGSSGPSESLAIDASAPEQPLPTTSGSLALDGTTTWTAPDDPPGLLVAQLELTVATTGGGGGGGGFEYCGGTVEIHDNGEYVSSIQLGVDEMSPNSRTLTTYRTSVGPIPFGLTDPTETQTITAKYLANPNAECAAGSKFDGLRIIVQPLG